MEGVLRLIRVLCCVLCCVLCVCVCVCVCVCCVCVVCVLCVCVVCVCCVVHVKELWTAVYCVLCTVYCVLCNVYCVLCTLVKFLVMKSLDFAMNTAVSSMSTPKPRNGAVVITAVAVALVCQHIR